MQTPQPLASVLCKIPVPRARRAHMELWCAQCSVSALDALIVQCKVKRNARVVTKAAHNFSREEELMGSCGVSIRLCPVVLCAKVGVLVFFLLGVGEPARAAD